MVVLQAQAGVVAGQVAVGVVAERSERVVRQGDLLDRIRAAAAGAAGVDVGVGGVATEVGLPGEVAHGVEAVLHRAGSRARSYALHQAMQFTQS